MKNLMLIAILGVACMQFTQAQYTAAVTSHDREHYSHEIYHQYEGAPLIPANVTIRDRQVIFPGGLENLYMFIEDNLNYPNSARQSGVEGTVRLALSIDAEGQVTRAQIVDGLTEACNQEVLRLAAMMPKWIPAIRNSRPVQSSVIVPIAFKLR